MGWEQNTESRLGLHTCCQLSHISKYLRSSHKCVNVIDFTVKQCFWLCPVDLMWSQIISLRVETRKKGKTSESEVFGVWMSQCCEQT